MIDLKDFIEAIKESKPKTSAYDTTATVRRVEGNTAWVHIPGGLDETPVKMTVNAQAGDTVQVRVSGGSAFIVGNATAPPTDDTKAIKVEQKVGIVERVVTAVKEVADTAARIAGNTRQYFWFVSDVGSESGAHITEVPQDEFLADPDNGGGNLLARSNGIAVRNGRTELATFGASLIELGKNSISSVISLCKDIMTMSVDSSLADSVRGKLTAKSSYPSYKATAMDLIAKNGTKEALIEVFASSDPVNDTTNVYMVADEILATDENGFGRIYTQKITTTWTAPAIASNLVTIQHGGYYTEGKRVYVQIEFLLASELSGDTTLSEFLTNLPIPSPTIGVLSIETGAGGYGWAGVKTNGKMSMRLNKTTGTSTSIYITGVYTTA